MGHTLCRSWCELCIAGQGREDAHRKHCRNGDELLELRYDYRFLKVKDEEEFKKDPGHNCPNMLVVRESQKGMLFAHAVP